MFHFDDHPDDLERGVRKRLADSLEHIVERVGDRLDIEPDGFDATLDRIRAARVNPGVYARYFDLVFAIDGGRWDEAKALGAAIVTRARPAVEFQILPYNENESDDEHDRLARLAFMDFGDNHPLITPEPQLVDGHRRLFAEAIAIIDEIDPGISQEIESLLALLIVAVQKPQGVSEFGGVTSLMTWGCSIINAKAYAGLQGMVNFLVHEITHLVLFGYNAKETLIGNPYNENYPSPLRRDPRPMDGVFHATVVAARLAIFAQQCLDSAAGSREIKAWAEGMRRSAREAFLDGQPVVREHGILSEPARDMLDYASQCLAGKT